MCSPCGPNIRRSACPTVPLPVLADYIARGVIDSDIAPIAHDHVLTVQLLNFVKASGIAQAEAKPFSNLLGYVLAPLLTQTRHSGNRNTTRECVHCTRCRLDAIQSFVVPRSKRHTPDEHLDVGGTPATACQGSTKGKEAAMRRRRRKNAQVNL